MLLTVDIGNSHITLGVFDGEELRFTARMATEELAEWTALITDTDINLPF